MNDTSRKTSGRVSRLNNFRELIQQYSSGGRRGNRRVAELSSDELSTLRTEINKESHWARQQTIEAGCFQTVTIGPPPAIGGLIASNIDPFGSMFNPPYGRSLFPLIIDMIDRSIGVISNPIAEAIEKISPIQIGMRKNFAFVAMSINDERSELIDLLDSIKEAASRCGIQAERIDEDRSNERITDRILESIRVAEHVIVDLTDERPNVFFEAGFAHGLGKWPAPGLDDTRLS